MADKGVMIALRIDRERIRALAPLNLETPLAGAAIVAPAEGEFRRVAEEVRRDVAALTGSDLPLLDEAAFSGAAALPAGVVAIGHAANNQLLRRMHSLKYLGDGDTPSDGLRAISMHNPFGDGHNVLAALGYTPEVAARSAARLLGALVQRDGMWQMPGRVQIAEPAPATPDPAGTRRAFADASRSGTGRPSAFLTALRHLNAAGEERWARAFVEMVTPYATGQIPLSFWLMSAVDFWTQGLVTLWDAAEEFPFFTDEERLLVANFVASCTEYCHDSITYQKWRLAESEHQVFNHHTFPASGLYFGARYLRVHGYALPELDGWTDKALRIFARAAEAGRSFDEGGAGYSWLVGNHLLDVSLAHGDTSYARSEKLKRYADLAVVIQNNQFELVPFGDCGGYHSGGTGAGNILLRAAEWHNAPGYKWVAERHAPAAAQADVLARAVPSAPPQEHLGLFVLPLDPVIHRWMGLPRFPNYPLPNVLPNVPAEQSFDKLSFRGGWGPNDDYLLLQGFGDGQHGHPDANAISQFQVNGRLFLAESDYIRRMPKQHNMVMVLRDGAHGPIPSTARLDLAREFPGGAVTQTSLVDYNGCDWQRTLIWLAGDCLVCVDTLRARAAGDYALRCYWRTLAETEQTDRGLHTDHQGEHFHVIELTESERRLDTEPIPLNATQYPEYRYGAGIPHFLCESQSVRLEAGEEACFVNLLLPNGQSAEPRRSIKWQEYGQYGQYGRSRGATSELPTLPILPTLPTPADTAGFVVAGDGPALTVDAAGFQVAGGERQAFANPLLGVGAPARPAPSAAALPPAEAREQWHVSLPAPATCMAPTGDGGALVGCEDGSVVVVDRAGEARRLAKAGERIGAVAAGRLWGEKEATFLAAGYDATLRLVRPDGTERLVVDLPDGSHLPAWGRGLCLADLDGDGRLWPVVGTAAWRVHAVNPDGSLRWTVDTASHSTTCLAAGDLNGDGRDEIAVATVYFCLPALTADGERLWQDEDYNDYWQAGPNFPFVAIGDVDGDGAPEVVTVGSDTLVHCISHTGEKKWTLSVGDEAAGLALSGERIAVASLTGDLHLLNGRGERLWRVPLGSPCTALALAGGRWCASTEAGDLVWIDGAGRPVGRFRLPAPARHQPAAGAGALLAATADGGVYLVEGPA